VWYLRGVVDNLLRYDESTGSDRDGAQAGGRPELIPAEGLAGLTLHAVAAALGMSVSAVRGHVRHDRLAALRVQGKRGPEYRVSPAVVTAFAAERSDVDAAAQGNGSQAGADAPTPHEMRELRELRERLEEAAAEVARCRAQGADAAGHYRDELTRLQDERDAALVRANALTAELERMRSRRLLGRLFGG
jgi:hypothetical protein